MTCDHEILKYQQGTYSIKSSSNSSGELAGERKYCVLSFIPVW